MSTVPATALLAELTHRGIELQVRGDRLRYRPRSALTQELAERVRAHKAELLAILAPSERYSPPPPESPAPFNFVDGLMDFGDICAGWTPANWAAELRRKADRCDAYRPDIAGYYRRWASDIERREGW